MAISKGKKEEVLAELKDALKSAQVVVFTDFTGMDVPTLLELRRRVRETGGSYKVAKKSLLALALKEQGIEGVDPRTFEGEIAVAFGMKDPAATSKAVYQLQKEVEKPGIVAGIMGAQILSMQEVIQLATLPSREELLARLVGSINAPVSGLVQVMSGNARGLVYALKAIAEQKA